MDVKTKPTVRTVAVIGNPNTGKSTLFNALTGLKQHVGNYPGVTVERKTGTAQLDAKHAVELIDLPGTYSLAPRSPDEMIAVDVLLNQLPGVPGVDAILAIADASNPDRNFYLISQLLELGLPVVVALNMLDVAATKGISVDTEKIGKTLGVRVVGICANKGTGLDELKSELLKTLDKKKAPTGALPQFPAAMNAEVDALLIELNAQKEKLGRPINRLEAFRALVDNKGGHAQERLASKLGPDFLASLDAHRIKATGTAPLMAEEVRTRYAWIKNALAGAVTRPAQPPATRSDAMDKWVTHWFSGTVIFIVLMFLVFESIFFVAKPVMDLIAAGFDALGGAVAEKIPEGALQSLLTKGVIKGVGGVLVFLPQIVFLFLFIAIMEDCGYMARAAFLMDRLLSRAGLSGKSFIPMLSSFACAVPGIMATRTIENWRDRLTTILVAPLMTCSARLPVYGLMIAAFIPATGYLNGFIGLQGLVLFAMYFLGIAVAVPVAWILKKTLLKGETPPFLIELPSYKIPDWRGVLLRVIDRAKAFVVRAGTIILAVSIVVWALAYFPHPPEIAAQYKAEREALIAKTTERIDKATLTPPEKPAGEDKSTLFRALEVAAKYDRDRDTQRDEAAKESDAARRAEFEKVADEKHADNMRELSKVNGINLIWKQIVDGRNAQQFVKTREQAAKIDAKAESEKSELEKIADEKEREAKDKSIDAQHDAAIEALAKDPVNEPIWSRVVEIRDAEKTQKDGLDELKNQETGAYLGQSYFGRMGKTVEPAFTPLGWDWRISMAAIASFPAREVIVATLGTIFSQGEDAKAESASMQDAIKKAEWEESAPAAPVHRKLFNIPVALSVMVFFALCSQCAATLATIKRETNSWWWPLFSFTYMTALAYIGAMLTYQIGMRL